jgi:hypothetical protein
LRWEGAGILTGDEEMERPSILREGKSEFETITLFVIINSFPSKVD